MDGAAARAVRRVVMLSFHNECSEQLAKGENDEMKAKQLMQRLSRQGQGSLITQSRSDLGCETERSVHLAIISA